MDSSDQRRKRKRAFIQTTSYRASAFMCFSFLTFLYIISSSSYAPFKPTLVASRLPSMASSRSLIDRSFGGFRRPSSPPRIDGRVSFPDHVLLLISEKVFASDDLHCVYYSVKNGEKGGGRILLQSRVISVDEYGEFRSIVRCPPPPLNSTAVDLGRRRLEYGLLGRSNNGVRPIGSDAPIPSWDNVAYEAVPDGDTVVVFAKGLNLRPGRESDPARFSCRFEWGRNRSFTEASTAAQEVVRCPLPPGIGRNREIRVTIGVSRDGRSPNRRRIALLSSVAKIVLGSGNSEGMIGPGRAGRKKYDLCACTMLWNQAGAIREWIAYHSWLGIERWFIYDNNSDDGTGEVIQELAGARNYNVSRHAWPWVKTQEAGFSHCAIRAKSECEWVSFMDVDEYFYFPYHTHGPENFRALGSAAKGSLRQLVGNFSGPSNNIAEIRTSCHSFGPSGLGARPARGVVMGYTCRLQSPERHKSIVRPEALHPDLLNVVHHFRLAEGYDYADLPRAVAVINHYKYQAWEDFKAKFRRRVATYVVDWRENQNEGSKDRAPGLGTEAVEPADWSRRFCEVWDTGLKDFVLSNMADVSTGLLPWESGSGFID